VDSAVRAILDTSVVLATDIDELPGELAISAVTLAELYFGVLIAPEQKILQREFDALPIDDAVAASYGQLAAAVVDAGRQPRARTMDLLIAATVHAHAACLYTCNANDFVGVDNLIEVVPV
jgi:toxin FitB